MTHKVVGSVLAIALATLAANAATIGVPDDYSTIGKALEASEAGDTVLVKAGTYDEQVSLKGGVTLSGEDRDAVIIQCGADIGPVVTVEDSKDAALKSLTLRHTNHEKADADLESRPSAALVRNGTCRIEECLVRDSTSVGLEVTGDSGVTVTNTGFQDTGCTSLWIHDFAGTSRVEGCEFVDSLGCGITVGTAPDASVTIEGCKALRNAWSGVVVSGPLSEFLIQDCEASENEYTGIWVGVKVDGEVDPEAASGPPKHTVARNVAEKNTIAGFRVVSNGIPVSVIGNRCLHNKEYGFRVDRDPCVLTRGNVYTENGIICEGEIGRLLEEERFGDLEAIGKRLRDEKSLFVSSEWQLPFFYRWIGEGFAEVVPANPDRFLGVLERWREAYPNSITQKVAHVAAYRAVAWAYRGTGYAYKVPENAWQPFRENLCKAYELLVETDRLDEKDPHLYSLAVGIMMGLQQPNDPAIWTRDVLPKSTDEIPEADVWFFKGMELDPLYWNLYYSKAFSLLPRWGGQPQDIEAFADKTGAALRERCGEGLYARIADRANKCAAKEYEDLGFDWERVKQGHIDILAKHPGSSYYKNWFCRAACMHDDRATAKEQLLKITDDIWDDYVWGSDRYYRDCRKWAGIEEPE